MRVLVVGAGVVGSFNAARLKDVGRDVTLLARGSRFAELRQHGVVLERFGSGERTVTRVPLVEQLAPQDDYDLALVVVRSSQLSSVLPILARNSRIPNVLFLGNHAAGPQDLITALGRERVLLGMANVGGARQDAIVRYLWSRWMAMLFGELEGGPTARTRAIARFFNSSGLPARLIQNPDAYLKTHAAGLPPLAGAAYLVGGTVQQLARTPSAIKLCLESFREALRALRAIGVPVKPAAMRLIEWLPLGVLSPLMRWLLASRLAARGAQPHLDAAADEMKELTDQFRVILRQANLPSPASDVLFAQVDARFAQDVSHQARPAIP